MKLNPISQIKTTNLFTSSRNNKIVILDKFKLNDGVKNFVGYKIVGVVTPLCIILPQMSGFINYFENKKNMSILADDNVVLKHKKQINWKKVKKLVGVEFDSQPVCDKKYIETKLLKTKLLQNLHTMKSLKKMLIILVLLQFILIM